MSAGSTCLCALCGLCVESGEPVSSGPGSRSGYCLTMNGLNFSWSRNRASARSASARAA